MALQGQARQGTSGRRLANKSALGGESFFLMYQVRERDGQRGVNGHKTDIA
jgi:hypothetical protein